MEAGFEHFAAISFLKTPINRQLLSLTFLLVTLAQIEVRQEDRRVGKGVMPRCVDRWFEMVLVWGDATLAKVNLKPRFERE
jgi:hypothetical protein